MIKPIRSTGNKLRNSKAKLRKQRREKSFNLESLEQRVLLAVSPQLIGVQPNVGEVLAAGDVRSIAPRELVFRFDSGQAIDPNSLDGIRLTRSGGDGLFGTANDVTVEASREVGLRGNDVVLRFGENLPDDNYRIDIIGTGGGPTLKNVDGDPFDADPTTDGIQNLSLDFALDLGTQVSAVVPQPMTRDGGGNLVQVADQIEVYFDDTDLNPTLAGAAEYYQLILTGDTVTNTDDTVFLPTSVDYVAAEGKAVLTFADALDSLAGGAATYRLRVGTAEAVPPAPLPPNSPAIDPGDSFVTSLGLGALNDASQIITSAIDAQAFLPTFPGSESEPGHRSTPLASHFSLPGDTTDGVTVIEYNFQQVYGTDPSGNNLVNLISDTQKQRARETFEIYGGLIGVDFIESAMNGFTIATGDLRAVRPTIPTGPGGVLFANAVDPMNPVEGLLVLDNAEDWNDEFMAAERPGQPSYYLNLVAGIGEMLGANRTSALPPLTATGDTFELAFENETEIILPGAADIVHVQHTYRPDSIDIDLYSFEIAGDRSGLFSAEIFAERLTSVSLLDSVLRLYRDTGAGMELIAQNDDYFSEDSFLQVALEPGTYYVGISSTGNADYDPSTSGTGFGGTSQGHYELRLDFRPEITDSLTDASGVVFDGDGDGTPGGIYNFWFRTAATAGTEEINEQQQFSIAGATAGTFTLTFAGEETNPIAFDATAADVQAELEMLSNIAAGDVVVSGDQLPDGSMTIEFTGNLAGMDVGEISIDASGLTDGTPSVITTVAGGVGARIIYVDKSDSTSDSQDDVGTLANPYGTIHDALNLDIDGLPKTGTASDPNAARAGDIVRIVGNADSLHYEIGVDILTNQPHEDGRRLDIPKEVTVMVDAGAIFKLERSGILVGSTAVAIDHSKAAFQVLGTPDTEVIFTSTSDDLVNNTGVRGQWGGIVFAGDFDKAEGRAIHEDEGIFLNHVTHANIRYGGGIVNVASVPQAVAPIDIRDDRPTIRFNEITKNGVAAIAASPDSFKETNFHGPMFQTTPFTTDYTRVGPDMQDNFLRDNTINGVFIRIETPAGDELRRMTVNGRWDDADIVHFLAEVLEVQGTPGGPINTGGLVARQDARLAIDPNIIVKLDSARIETGVGAQLIAEGLDGQEVVFTSIFDDRFGASGSFDTSNNADMQTAAPGDWGGIYFGQSSTGSIDHAFVTLGGGISAVEGNFVGFNAIEVHQAEARITNSILINNAGGLGGQGNTSREGRGINASGVIFVLGAQPIIVGNSIVSSGATDPALLFVAASSNDLVPAITIDANALNLDHRRDYGRSMGLVDRFRDTEDNQGPLIRDNRLQDNDVNGLVVRGATLTTESVWDDTDITHIVWNNIHVPDFHTFGGLRLESSPTESLVVKLGGNSRLAGFDTTGLPLDISDRIGGSLHVIGQPGRPVILTSIVDETVGAGAALDGSFQNQTLRPGFGVPPEETPSLDVVLNFGAGFNGAPQAVAALEEAAAFWEERISDDIIVSFDVFINDLGDSVLGNASGTTFAAPYDEVVQRMQADAAANELELLSQLPTFSQLDVAFPMDNNTYTFSEQLLLPTANAKALGYEFAPEITDGVINIDTQFATGGNFQSLQFVMIHEIGHALGFSSSADNIPDGGGEVALTTLDLFRMAPGDGANDFTNNPRMFDPEREQVFFDGGFFDPTGIDIAGLTAGDVPLSRGTETEDMFQASHWREDSSPEMRGIYIGIMDPAAGRNEFTKNDERAFGLLGYDFSNFTLSTEVGPGNWRGLQMDQFTNDRNVDVITERESSASDAQGANGIPDRAEFVGALASGERSGDENLRLGFEVFGVLNAVDDVDIYSFEGMAGTQVWLDLDHTASSLDSVVELVNAEGTSLAISDNSFDSDQMDPLGAGTNPLPLSGDFFSVNPQDAGMSLTLPGAVATTGTYFVRVRSSSDNLDNVDGGLTKGAYELNVRLRETDEIPGTVVKHADIRYAKNGIEISGIISNSPLQGEGVEADDTTFANPLVLGNVQETGMAEISVSAELEDRIDNGMLIRDVDWYLINVSSAIPGVTFDIDYADGTGNPNTHLSIFRKGRVNGTNNDVFDLVFAGDASNVTDDFNSLQTGGTFGSEDPFIGPALLGPGFALDESGNTVFFNGDYLIAVTSEIMRPDELVEQFLFPDASNPDMRLQPLSGVSTVAPGAVDVLQTAVIPFALDDMTLFVAAEDGGSLFSVNPFTGDELEEGSRPLRDGTTGYTIGSLAMRGDGSLYSLSLGNTDDDSGNFLNIDWAQQVDGADNPTGINVENVGDDGIVTFHAMPGADPMVDPPEFEETGDGIQFQGMTFADAAYGVGNRGGSPDLDASDPAPDYTDNVVYRIDGYPTQIDGNATEPGTALNIINSDDVHEPPADPPPPYPFRGAFTDIIEVGHFDTTVGGPGGTVQGLATLNGSFYGVTDGGGLYKLDIGGLDSAGTTSFIATIGSGPSLTGLTLGPPSLENGAYAATFFAIASNGSLFAFDDTGAPEQIFRGNRSRVATAAQSPTGLAFSTLDQNLWQLNPAGTAITFTAPTPNNDPVSRFFVGNQSTVDAFNADYNYPGGSHGYFESTIDLSSYSAGDEPALYFSYELQTEHLESNANCDDFSLVGVNNCTVDRTFRDAFRVYADDGTGWKLLATNDSASRFGDFPDRPDSDGFLGPFEMFRDNEFDILPIDGRPDNNGDGYGIIQELFDNTGRINDDAPLERQVRASLEEVAGSPNVRLRFEFSTEGSFDDGRVGDDFGDPLRVTTRNEDGTTDNQFFGATVRNVIVGLAERGEQIVNMILDPPRIPNFSEYPAARDNSILEGDYQLIIRPAFWNNFPFSFDTNEQLDPDVSGGSGFGDTNRFRAQGQLIIHSNQIMDSEEYGIRIEPAPDDFVSASDLLVPNVDRLVRGVVVENNVIANNGEGGILYTGNSNGTAAVPFGRLINNTIVGNVLFPSTVGIEIGPQASPTLMNNIIAYAGEALTVDSTSASSVIVGQLLHGNAANGPLGDFSIISQPSSGPFGSDGLFRNPLSGNFLLADGAIAIDSSINSQEDRPAIAVVNNSLGLGLSPMLAPERDKLGQLRIDDPMVESPPGQGANVIKDRGALERADDVGPRAEILIPSDNSVSDLDPDVDQVSTDGETFSLFEIRLFDIDISGNDLFGVGIDDATVTTSGITMRRDAEELEQGVDYEISYDSTNDILRLIPLAGIWVSGVYEVELEPTIADLAGNALVGTGPGNSGYFIVGVDRDAVVVDPGGGWHNAAHPADVNDDGIVVAQDAIIVINEISLRRFSDETGRLQDQVLAPPFYDVNDDGFVAANDVIIIINEINQNLMAPLSAGVGGTDADEEEIATGDSTSTLSGDNVANATLDVALRSYRPTPVSDVSRLIDGVRDDESDESNVDAMFADWA